MNNSKDKQSDLLAVGLTGVVIGAATVLLTNADMRDKTKKKALALKNKLNKWSAKTIEEISDKKDTTISDLKDRKEKIEDEMLKDK